MCREYLPELERVTKERDAKLAAKQTDSLNRFMKDLAVSGPQTSAPPTWNEEDEMVEENDEDEDEETEDVWGGENSPVHLISAF